MAVQVIPGFHDGTFGDTCLLCQTAVPSPARPHDRIIDLGIWLDADEGVGWLAICETCATEIAALIGCLPTRQGEILIARNHELQARIETLESNADKLRSLVS